MAKKQWTKQKVNPEDINNGNEYDIGDQLSLEALNAIVNNSFYGAEHGGSGGDYTAGNGLKLTEKQFSIDPDVVVQQTDLNKVLFSSTTNEEVWLIPVRPTLNYNSWNTTILTMNFRSGSKNYKQFKILLDHSDDLGLIYDSTRVYTRTFTQDFWLNESYRTIILQEPATGNIKTWLENIGAVKQGEAGTPNKNTGDVGTIKQKTGDDFYPKTFIDAVYDDNGNPLNNLMPVANPTLDGTETNLTALSVNGTKYKIASGGSGGDYTAGTGINITDNTISADTNVLATKEDIPTGETDITFNGTPTTTSEDLSNVVIGDTTYLVPSNTEVNAMKVKINNSLQLPETAPTSTKLVGIDTNKAQTNIGIGEGLSLENGTLKATGGGGGGSGSGVLYNHSIDLYNTSGKSLTFTFMCSIAKFNNKEELRNYFNAPRQKSFCIGQYTQNDINYVIFSIGGSNSNNIFSLEYFSYVDEETKTDFTLIPIDFDMSDITDFIDNASEV